MNHDIKAVIPTNCPSCGEGIVIQVAMQAPELISLLTMQQVEDIKKKAKERILSLDLESEVTNEKIEFIENPELVFSEDDIENIIKNITGTDYDSPKKN